MAANGCFAEESKMMEENIKKRNRVLAERVIKGLKSRNMTGYFAENKEVALKKVLELIPEGSSVGMGGCFSAQQIGLVDALKEGDYSFIDRSEYEDPREAYLKMFDADVFLSSANALTADGIIINIDGNANRVSAIAYGPKKVVFIVGMNKVCHDFDSAMGRARNIAAPMNTQRFAGKQPCTLTGMCADCKSLDTICCQFLVTRFSRQADRIHVILVNEELGY